MTALKADKQTLLSGLIGRLTDDVAARLARAVEVDRLNGGTELPHDEILRVLRPQLKEAAEHVERVPTPERLFCRPFEDLLVEGERKTKQKGRIARSSIEPVWKWLHELMPQRLGELVNVIGQAILSQSENVVEAKLALLWDETARALKTALDGDERRNRAAQRLGAMMVVEDAVEMALLLARAKTISEVQKRLPKPIASLSQNDIWFVSDMSEELFASDPDFAPYVALVVMGRLKHPWEALHLAGAISGKADDIVISSTDMGVVGELLFSDLDGYARNIQFARPVSFDPKVLVENLAVFTELSSGMVKEIGIRRDGKWGQRLAKDRAAVAQIMEGLLARTPKEIFAALPPYKFGSTAKGQKQIDLSRPSDPERVGRAMRYAQLMMQSRPYSVAAAFSAKLNEIIDETQSALRGYAEDVLREVRSTPADARAHSETHFAIMFNICELVLGKEETEFLRRRAKAAAA